MAKQFRAKVRAGRIEPLEPVDLLEGQELEVTVETPEEADEWFKDLYDLFAPVRKELEDVPGEEIDRRIARAVKAVRATKRGQV